MNFSFLQDLGVGGRQGDEEQTEHLQTGLLQRELRPQKRTAQQGPIRSTLLARRGEGSTSGLSGLPAAGLTCACLYELGVCGGKWKCLDQAMQAETGG